MLRMNSPSRYTRLAKSNAKVEKIEGALLMHTEHRREHLLITKHYFERNPGKYIREVWRPADTFIIGHEHRTGHWNELVSGRLSVWMLGKWKHMEGPCRFFSDLGVRKLTYSHTDALLRTEHQTDETDLEKLESELIVKSDTFTQFELQQAVQQLNLEKTLKPSEKELVPA